MIQKRDVIACMDDEQAVVRKVLWRLIPFGVLCYLLNYIDRVNISVAKLKMVEDVAAGTGIRGFTEGVFSTGAAIFFLGYCLFELPSNLIMERVGARRWMARIMISWGLLTMCFVFTRGAWSFYILRFFLGAFEAGFFPGMILYLSYWVPHRSRAAAAAMFLTSTAISGVVGNPLGGLILYLTDHRPLGVLNWQWLFLCEGIPSVLVGIAALIFLTDRPSQAKWLTEPERETLVTAMARERAEHISHDRTALKDAFVSPHTWVLSAFYGLAIFGFYMVNFYTPTIIKASLISGGVIQKTTPALYADLWTSLLSAIPFGAAAIGMVLIGRHSDKRNERKYHLAFTCVLSVVGLTVAALGPGVGGGWGTLVVIGGLSLGAMGAFGMFGPFWALPPQLLTGTAAAGAFAIINSIGNFFGGFMAPMMQKNVGMQAALLTAAGLSVLGFILAVLAPIPRHPPRMPEEPRVSEAVAV